MFLKFIGLQLTFNLSLSEGTEMHVRLHTQRPSPNLVIAYKRSVKTSHTEF